MNIARKSQLFCCVLFLFIFSQNTNAQHISCSNAQIIKDKTSINIPFITDYTGSNTTKIGCFQDTLHQAHWFKFTALTSGSFLFAAQGINLAADYDFVLFSEACPCDTMASKIVACNWIGAILNPPYVPTGISDNPATDFGITDPMAPIEFEPSVNLKAGTSYYLILDNISNNDIGFELRFGGTAQIGAPVTVPLPSLGVFSGKNEVCSNIAEIFEVDTDIRFSDYEWKIPSDATIVGTENKAIITFGQKSGEVCVIAKNACVADTACKKVTVHSTPNLALNEAAYFCKQACFDIKDIKFVEKNNIQNTGFQLYNNASNAWLGDGKNLAPNILCQSQKLWLRATSPKNCFDTLAIDLREMENPSVVMVGGGVACFGDTASLSFSFTGVAPYNVTYTDGVADYSFTTNKTIIAQKIYIDQQKTIKIKDFSEKSMVCLARKIGEATFFPSVNCACLKKAGTMQSLTVDACENTKATGIHNKDEVKTAADKLVFILHSVASPDLGTVYATSDSPTFSFMSGLMYEIPYYISAVVGVKKTDGNIDFSDKCLGISAGVPIVFHQAPSATFSGDSIVCNNQLADISITPKGNGPFDISYGNPLLSENFMTKQAKTIKVPVGTIYLVKIEDKLGCKNTYTDTITVKTPTKITTKNIKYTCNASQTAYTLSLTLQGGDAQSYTANGLKGTLTKNLFVSEEIPSGATYKVIFKDKNACDSTSVSDDYTCACNATSTPATLNSGNLIVCKDLAATASFNQDEVLQTNHIAGFVLHTDPIFSISNILTFNKIPQFQLLPNMSVGITYYITSLAGPKQTNGIIAYNSPCTVFGKKSVPITFIETPIVALSGVSDICEKEEGNITFNLSGTSPYEVGYFDGQKNILIQNIKSNDYTIMVNPSQSTNYKLLSVKTMGVPGCVGQIDATKNTVQVNVHPSLFTENFATKCSDDKKTYQVIFDIKGGKPNTYEVNGVALNNGFFMSNPIADGENYSFDITSNIACKTLKYTGKGYCSCPADASMEIKIIQAIQCRNEQNGVLKAMAKNLGNNPTYRWNTGANTQMIENLKSNLYIVTVSNNTNCVLIDSIFLKNPNEIRVSIETTDVQCFGENSGEIAFMSVEGGTKPYTYSIDNQFFTKESVFPKLKSNLYELVVKDANACLWKGASNITQPEAFYVTVGDNQIINLGQTTQIQAIVSQNYKKITWSEPTFDGLLQSITPMKSHEYTVTATDKNGCVAKDALWIYVKTEREVFAPNTFSPNGDNKNDGFTIFAGDDVLKINTLRIFDRWGSLIFETNNILPNDTALGWQGTHKQHIAKQDQYIYSAEIEYIDGKKKNFSGEIILMQ